MVVQMQLPCMPIQLKSSKN